MIKGIQYTCGMDVCQPAEAGFTLLEYSYRDSREPGFQPAVSGSFSTGMRVEAAELLREGLDQVLGQARECSAAYLMIETEGLRRPEDLAAFLEDGREAIGRAGIEILIENSRQLAEACELRELADRLNTWGGGLFGLCLNTGYANVMARNIGGMIEELGSRIRLLRVSDNDGSRNERQLPFTFTRGRGQLVSDWYQTIGCLALAHFRGPVVFDTAGLFHVSPPELYPAWYRLLAAIAGEWEPILDLETKLSEKPRRILFGAGRMFDNYMEVWGETYPPAFIVDNKKELWGSEKAGVPIYSPDRILEEREEDRLALICNMYYDEIREQLTAMGIASDRYDDKYFFKQLTVTGGEGCPLGGGYGSTL